MRRNIRGVFLPFRRSHVTEHTENRTHAAYMHIHMQIIATVPGP